MMLLQKALRSRANGNSIFLLFNQILQGNVENNFKKLYLWAKCIIFSNKINKSYSFVFFFYFEQKGHDEE